MFLLITSKLEVRTFEVRTAEMIAGAKSEIVSLPRRLVTRTID